MNPLLPPYISGGNQSMQRVKLFSLQQVGEKNSQNVVARQINHCPL